MTFCPPPASALAAIAVVLWLALAPNASAQDAMELDLAFKNSMSQVQAPQLRDQTPKLQEPRHKARSAQGLVAKEKRRIRM
jgi:hypothetical protein